MENDAYDKLSQELSELYGPPCDKGIKNGSIYKCLMNTHDGSLSHVTITCYPTTTTLSIQGNLHDVWVESTLQAIGLKLKPAETIHSDSVTSSSTSCQTSYREIGVQTCNSSCEAGTQTDDCETPTELQKDNQEPSSLDITLPDTEIESSPVDTTPHVDTPADSPSDSSTDSPCHVATIPTSNSFAILDIEEPNEPIMSCEQPEPVQAKPHSVPEPKKVRPVPKPRKRIPTTTDNTLPTVPPPQTPTGPSQKPHYRKRILILGDSITKGLVGCMMSRQHTILNRSISGTTIEHWIHLTPIFIEEEKPDIVLLHCGTNNFTKGYTNEAIGLIEKLVLRIHHVNSDLLIGLSALTTQRNLGHQYWINEFNARLMNICLSQNFLYINHDNITKSSLTEDGIHIRSGAVCRLAQNFISVIKQVDQFFPDVMSQGPRR